MLEGHRRAQLDAQIKGWHPVSAVEGRPLVGPGEAGDADTLDWPDTPGAES